MNGGEPRVPEREPPSQPGGGPGMPAQLGPLQRAILDLASRSGGYVRLSEAARALGTTPGSVSSALRHLEARGLARRVSKGLYVVAADLGRAAGGPGAAGGGGAPGSRPPLGPLQRDIVSYVLECGLRRFTPSGLAAALGANRVRVWCALKSLEARGLVRRVARGLYEVAEDPNRLASLLAEEPAREGPRVDGPRPASATARCRLLDELQYAVAARGLGEMAGELAIYTGPGDGTDSVRVEWRVPRRALGRRGRPDEKAFWDDVARALAALLAISLARGPPDHVRRVLRLARSLPQPSCAKARAPHNPRRQGASRGPGP